MPRFLRRAVLVLALSAFAAQVRAEDAENCKDSKLFTRFPGSSISDCSVKEFDEIDLPVATKGEEVVNKHLEGRIETIVYQLPENTSSLQVMRNYETAFRKAGFETTTGKDDSGYRYVFAHRAKDDLYVTATVRGSGDNVLFSMVTPKAMEQSVSADANAMLDELNKSGHVAVYGINFDTGKATIKSDSEATLSQIAKLLTDNADLKLRIEGHTDNQGTAKTNLDLSMKRADAVKAWLVTKQIEAGRLTTQGFGDKKPVADNDSDEGRAKNRRVELVKK